MNSFPKLSPTTHRTFLKINSIKRNSALDSLRGFSTILIVVYHVFAISGYTVTHANSTGAYTQRLNVGVTIFFVLSGFLIFRPFVHSLIHSSALPSVGHFYLKRAARILPGYWFALFILAELDALRIVNASGFTRNVFLVHPFTEDNVFSGIAQAWTLSVEMSFYIVVPLLAYAFRHRSIKNRSSTTSIRMLLSVLTCIFLGAYVFQMFIHQTHFWFFKTANIWLPSHMDTFALGMFVAVLVEAPAMARTLSHIKSFLEDHAGACVLGSVLVWLVSANINMPVGMVAPEFSLGLLCHFLYSISAFLLVAPFCVESRSFLIKVLSFRLFTWLGTISYGIYLWHAAIIGGNFAEKYMPYRENDGQVILRLLIVLPASIAIASLSYYLLERPITRAVSKRYTLQ